MSLASGQRVRVLRVSSDPICLSLNSQQDDFGIIDGLHVNFLGTGKGVAYIHLEKMPENVLETVWLDDITEKLFKIGERIVTDPWVPTGIYTAPIASWRYDKSGLIVDIVETELKVNYLVFLDGGHALFTDGRNLNLEKK